MTMLARQNTDSNNQASAQPKARPAASLEIKYRAEAASYVAAMIAELRQISGKAGFDKLVGVLDTAYYEAYTLMDPKVKAPEREDEKSSPPLEPSHS